jgi:SH3-like domain-containing protein
MILYPTGNSEGVWREVSDEVGNKGWVSNASLSLAK